MEGGIFFLIAAPYSAIFVIGLMGNTAVLTYILFLTKYALVLDPINQKVFSLEDEDFVDGEMKYQLLQIDFLQFIPQQCLSVLLDCGLMTAYEHSLILRLRIR